MKHEGRILLMAVAAGLPGSLVALILLWTGAHSAKVQWTLTVLIVGLWCGFALAVRRRVVFPLQTVSNLLAALREHGLPHQLLVLTDLSKALREEERLAWQRLLRVLGHELNNSLAPIRSIAGSLKTLLAREPRPEDWDDDARRGLDVIAGRSE